MATESSIEKRPPNANVKTVHESSIPGDDGAVRLRGDGRERDEHDAGVARLVEDAEVGDLAVEEDGDDVEVAVRDRVVERRVAVDVSQVDHPGGGRSLECWLFLAHKAC